jgi:molecular chaperone GrpE (heat shock protein)
MLDPLTAISLAGNIVQFVDFTAKVISKTRELARSTHGTTQEAYNAEIVIRDLLKLSEQLKDGARAASAVPQTDDDKVLEELCNGCISLSERMLKRLEKLKLGEGAGKRRAFLNALKGVWSQKELEGEEAQLAIYRSQLDFRVLTSFK